MGMGFFIFNISNAFLLTFLAILAGIFPIIGPTIIWVPLSIFLLTSGNTFQAVGIIVFGGISSTIDNLIRSVIISKRTAVYSPVVLIGMIGGFFYFGVLGILLGPLILSYFLIGIEIYRNKKSE